MAACSSISARTRLGALAAWDPHADDGWRLAALGDLPVRAARASTLGGGARFAQRAHDEHAETVTLGARAAGGGDVVVHARAHTAGPVLEQWLEVHAGAGPERIAPAPPSLVLRLAAPLGSASLEWWRSGWAEEWAPERAGLDESVRLDSVAGRSSARLHPFALLRVDDRLLAVAVAWSGNWTIEVERLDDEQIELRAGLGDPGFVHDLAPGASFRTPPVVVALAPDGDAGTAAAALARAGRRAWFAQRPVAARRPVEWNPWWPYEDVGIDEATFLAGAGEAHRLGLDVAVLDAGWFGDPGGGWFELRGDWDRVNAERFPRGLPALADATRALGIGFGLWLEIEAVGAGATLRARRADLLATRDGDDLGYVCLGDPAAQEWAFEAIAGHARACRLDWLKLDFNLDPGLGCSRTDHGHGRHDGLWAHVTGLYALLDRIRAAFPAMLVEACSSGGLRWDHGIARHVDLGFQSDADWPEHALSVFWAASLWFPPELLLHWCDSEWRGEHPHQRFRADDPGLEPGAFDFRLAIAMLGAFGLSQRLVDLPAWAADRVAHAARVHRETVAPCVARGELRRLSGQPLRSGGGARWVGFQVDVPAGGPARHLLAGYALPGAAGPNPLAAGGLEPGAHVRVHDLLADTEHLARADAAGRLPFPSDLQPERAWLATLDPVGRADAQIVSTGGGSS